MRVLVGTSGFSYPAWKGRFYPADLPRSRMLAAYSAVFPTVEINATFYRVPSAAMLAQWRAQVPDRFSFALKAPQRITHVRRLRDCGDVLARFYGAASELGSALGPVLFQLPPTMPADVARLEAFLEAVPPGGRTAFEFRHPTWLRDDVFAVLERRGVALCVAETDDSATPLVATAPFGYVRLRRTEYDAAALTSWHDRMAAQPWRDAYVFFKHEDEARGPAFAQAFRRPWADARGHPAEAQSSS